MHLDHLQRGGVVSRVGGAAAIFQQQTLKATVVGVAHRRVDADVGGDAGQDHVDDAAGAQDQFQVGGVETAFAGLVDDDFSRCRGQFGDDLPAGFAAHQDAAARAGIADPRADPPGAPALVRWQVGQIRAMPFPRVNDRVAQRPHRREQLSDRRDRRAGQRQVIAHLVHIAANAAEIGLHVDDDQRRVRGLQGTVVGPGIRIRRDRCHGHRPIESCPGMPRNDWPPRAVMISTTSVTT